MIRLKMYLILITSTLVSYVTSFAPMGNQCDEHQFACDNLNGCIPQMWVCDGQADCKYGSDEKESLCSQKREKICSDTQFKCENDLCLPMSWKCDGADDCGDNSDEIDCEITCSSNEFRCKTGQCISLNWKCDGHSDCSDSSDEEECSNGNKSNDKFMCKIGTKIPIHWKCDGVVDCSDGSDERECPSELLHDGRKTCTDDEFHCGGDYCVLNRWVCDGHADCPEGEDEKNCSKSSCDKDQFACSDGLCMEGHLRCNGVPDCVDFSDEANCSLSSPTASKECNLTTHFACDEDLCIPRKKLCDGHKDCPDFQDESEDECGVDECKLYNGGCEHTCVDTKEGYECRCAEGFRLYGKYSCQDIDECDETPDICSQSCTNTQGSYHCSCHAGYQRDPSDFRNCKAAVGETYLIFSHDYDIRRIRLRDHAMTSIVSDLQRASGLDYVFNDNTILWSDNKQKKLFRAPIENTAARETITENEEVSTDGLAVDWIHKNIYLTDNKAKTIKMITWYGDLSKTIITEDVGQPRAVAVSPFKGFVFWSDWGASPKIERSLLDGSERKAIVSENHVVWPNGITIDHASDHIFWVDGRLNSIKTCDFNGEHVKVVLFDRNVLSMPYSISVFEDKVYWTDWSKVALYSANKHNGLNIRNVSAGHILETPKVVRVFHQYRQPLGENVCQNSGCNHFCVRTVLGAPACTCADGYVLSSDQRTCVQKGEYSPAEIIAIKDNEESSRAGEQIIVENGDNRVVIEEETFTRSGSSQSVVMTAIIVGLGLLCVIAIVGFFGINRVRNDGRIKNIRFHNSVYKRTTDDLLEGGGMTIAQQQSMFSPSVVMDFPPQYTERDDVPLTSKD